METPPLATTWLGITDVELLQAITRAQEKEQSIQEGQKR